MLSPQLIAAIGSNSAAFSGLAGNAAQLISAAQSLQSMDTHSLVASASAAGLMSGGVAQAALGHPQAFAAIAANPSAFASITQQSAALATVAAHPKAFAALCGPAGPVCAGLATLALRRRLTRQAFRSRIANKRAVGGPRTWRRGVLKREGCAVPRSRSA